jgi:3-oxoacyl-[acyl-carrier protein] reductase
MMNLDLTGKRALVAGSTQGIGKAIAMQLAGQGAEIILVARNEDKLLNVKEELPTPANQEHHYIVADFGFPPQLKVLIEDWIELNGSIHILINNTGGPAGGPITEAKEEEFIHAFNNHLICNHILAKALIPGMKKEGYGRIINIISTSVKQPLSGLGVSNTIRGAVANWAKTMANELGQFNITVNNVLPGATNTVRLKSIIENKAAKTGLSIEEIKQQMANAVPMKRIAEPEEIANAAAFLASPAASYINGINLPVDGGRTGCL